jgi:hypothetical protein
MTPKERRERLQQLPFVKLLLTKDLPPCDGIRWSHVPLRAVWHPKTHKRQPDSELEPYRCRNRGRWKFTALKRSNSKSGVYCMSHLFVQLTQDDRERKRLHEYEKQWEKM